MKQQPVLFWSLIASMWVGNLMLVILNLPLVGIWAKVAEVPYRILYPVIVAISCVGSYAIGLKATDVYMLAAFGVIGYILVELDCELAPMLFGGVVGPMLEENMRRALIISRGDASVFIRRPVSAVLLAIAAIAIIVAAVPKIRSRREEVFKD